MRRLLFVVFGLVTLLFVQLGATFGLVFAVVAVTKDSKVGDGGALVARDGSYLGTTPVLLSVTSSDVPDDTFTDVRSLGVTLANGGGAAQLQINGFVRLRVEVLGANTQHLTYGPLMLMTPYGNMLLAGTTVTPLDSVLADMIDDATAAATSLFATTTTASTVPRASPFVPGSSSATVGAVAGSSASPSTRLTTLVMRSTGR